MTRIIDSKNLSVTRKKDREDMVGILSYGAMSTCPGTKVRVEEDGDRRGLVMHIDTPQGLSAMIILDANLARHGHCIHWHIRLDSPASDRRIASGFCSDVNPYHRQKATDVVDDFSALCKRLSARLKLILNDRAFDPS